MENLIVIATHISGIKFLDNLLASFGTYKKYPILIVINEYKEQEMCRFREVLREHSHLPITILPSKLNSFEFGGLYSAYIYTNAQNILVLSHSVELLDTKIFDIVFERYCNTSIAFGLMRSQLTESLIWHSSIGKYRRCILDMIILEKYGSFEFRVG